MENKEINENNESATFNEHYRFTNMQRPIEENILTLLNDFQSCSFVTLCKIFKFYNTEGLFEKIEVLKRSNYLTSDTTSSIVINALTGKNIAHLCALDLMCIMNQGNFIYEYNSDTMYPFSYLFNDIFHNTILILSLLDATKMDMKMRALKTICPQGYDKFHVLIIKHPRQEINVDLIPREYNFRIVNVYTTTTKVPLNKSERVFQVQAYKMSPLFFFKEGENLNQEILNFSRKDSSIWEKVGYLMLK